MHGVAPPDLRPAASRLAPRAALALAALLALPSLGGGFCADDIPLVLRLEGRLPGTHDALTLYRFADGTTRGVAEHTARGFFPWFTSPHLKLSFMRPLAGAMWRLDHALFGRDALGYHAHSIAWLLLLVGAAAALYRRALRPGLAALAALLFAVSDTHAVAVGWLASRHALVGATLALAGVALHVRARESGRPRGHLLALPCAALGLCASETALGVLAYLLAYELVGRGDAPARRARAALPAAALAAGYVVTYKLLGHGVGGTAAYLDPVAQPGAFLAAAPARAAILLGSFLGGVPADVVALGPDVGAAAVGVGVALALLSGALLASAWRALDPSERPALRWLLTGAALSVTPALGGFPGSRLLLGPSIGGAALLALLLSHAHTRARAEGRGWRVVLALLALLHCARPPLTFGLVVHKLRQSAAVSARLARDPGLSVTGRTALVVLTASDPLLAYDAAARLLETGETARARWTLSMARRDHEVTRVGDDALELRVLGGAMLESWAERLYRDPAEGFRAGDVVPLEGAEVRVLEAPGGAPTRIAVRFDRPLDDPTLTFATWRDGALRRVALPRVGEALRLPYTPGPTER